MVFLLSDAFLLLTQVLVWILIGLIIWYVLFQTLDRALLGWLILGLILVVLAISFLQGPPSDPGLLRDLWRVVSFPLTPLGLALILLLVLLTRKLGKVVRRFVIIGLVLLAFCSLPVTAYFLVQELEMEAVELIRPLPAQTAGRRVIVVLAQNATRFQLEPRQEPPPPNPPEVERALTPNQYQVLTELPTQLTEAGDRLIYTAQLYREGVAAGNDPLVVVTGGLHRDRLTQSGELKEEISESSDAQAFLTNTLGVPATSILVDHESPTVHRSAENVRRLLSDRGVDLGGQLVLVGSAIQLNRAQLSFQNVFGDNVRVFARPTDFYTVPPRQRLARVAQGRDVVQRSYQVADFVPDAEAFYWSSRAIEEYLTALYYFLRGWINPWNKPSLDGSPITWLPVPDSLAERNMSRVEPGPHEVNGLS